MALVLCIGTESRLMETRKMLLEQAGHKVVAVSNDSDLRLNSVTSATGINLTAGNSILNNKTGDTNLTAAAASSPIPRR